MQHTTSTHAPQDRHLTTPSSSATRHQHTHSSTPAPNYTKDTICCIFKGNYNIHCSWRWAYKPETCRAERTQINTQLHQVGKLIHNSNIIKFCCGWLIHYCIFICSMNDSLSCITDKHNAWECASVVRMRRDVWCLKYCSSYRLGCCVGICNAGNEMSADWSQCNLGHPYIINKIITLEWNIKLLYNCFISNNLFILDK